MTFSKSLDMGKLGEFIYYQAHQGELEQLDGFKSDFKMLETGQGVELKSDFYPMSSTKNFFMERYSNLEKGSPGGPWQSLSHSEIFVYMYVKDLTLFEFKTGELVTRLNDILEAGTIKPTDVKNSVYVSRGYRIPRDLLQDIAIEKKIEIKVKAK